MGLTLITAPAIEPVSLAEAKEQCEVEAAEVAWDALIDAKIRAARRVAELITGRALITQTWELALDGFPAAGRGRPWAEIAVPKPPLQSVVSLKYTDPAGAEQTLAAVADYVVDALSQPGRVAPAFGAAWPATRAEPNAVRLRFACGYGAGPESVDPDIKAAILLVVADLYRHREDTVSGATVAGLPRGVEALLFPHRAWGA